MFAALTYYDNVSTVNISNDFLMKNYHHGNLKEELTACAVKICESEGYANLSIRKLAKESNVSQTAPYRHFETKEHLYAEVAKIGFIELQKTVSKGKTFIDKGKEYLNFGLKKQNLYDLMFDKVVEDFSDYPDLLDAANKTAEDLQRSFAEFSGIEDEHEINIKSFTMHFCIKNTHRFSIMFMALLKRQQLVCTVFMKCLKRANLRCPLSM